MNLNLTLTGMQLIAFKIRSEKEFMFYCTVNVTFLHLMAICTQNYHHLVGTQTILNC